MRGLLLISLIANMGLVLAVGYGWKQKQSPAPAEEVAVQTIQEKPSTVSKTRRNSTKAEPRESAPATFDFSWQTVESPEYKTYIANLRAIYCPESTIADIIIADVEKHYRTRLAPLKGPDRNVEFWKNNNYWDRYGAEYEKAAREAQREKTKLLRDLLGSNYAEQLAKNRGWFMSEDYDPFIKNLPEDKRTKMTEIGERFSEEQQEVYRKAKGYHDQETQEELAKIEKAKIAELSKYLTPEEVFEYQLRHSQVAQQMKWNELKGLDVTEEEFRAIVKAKLAAEGNDLADDGENKVTDRDRAKRALDAEQELKKVLGEERFKDYQLNDDWDYRNLLQIVQKNGGGKEIAQQVHGMQNVVQQAALKVRNDKSLTREERNEKLRAIHDETQKTLVEALGERGFKRYKQNIWWLRELTRGIETKKAE